MITLSQLTELLGWTSVLNMGMLAFAKITLVIMKSKIVSVNSKAFGIPENEINICNYNYLARYKALTFIFFIAPYLALKIMGQ